MYADDQFALSSLFHGFPQFSAAIEPIVIESMGRKEHLKLSIQTGWYTEETESDGSIRRILQTQDHVDESEVASALVVEVNGSTRLLPLTSFGRYFRRSSGTGFPRESRIRYMFVGPYGGEQTGTLGALWDRIALSAHEEDVVNALQVIDPEIMAVSMVGGEGTRQPRTAIVRASNFMQRPVPLRSYGDGVNRLFGIVLSQVNAKDGLLLIDEFENGMHYWIQRDAWRMVFDLAERKLDIQVVANFAWLEHS